MEALIRGGARIDSAVLIGGGAKSQIVQQMMANILHIPVEVPQPAEYVALGAAWQAMRLRVPDLQPWAPNMTRFDPQGDDGAWERYQDAISLRAHRGS